MQLVPGPGRRMMPADLVPPHAEPLALRHQAVLTRLLRFSASPLSEYSFANLFLFRDRHEYRLVQGSAPAMLGRTYDGERHAMPLAPLTAASIDAMLDRADCLYPMDEAEAVIAARHGLAVDWREADSDYVYDRGRLSRLDGAKERRSQAAGFAERFAPSAETLTPALAPEVEAVLDGWLADTGRAAAATDAAACLEALSLLQPLGLAGLLVRTEAGVPAGFLISSIGAGGSALVHFAKGRRAYTGLYAWMFRHFATLSEAAELNFEQDLGNPGLAQSKRAFAPSSLRRKLRFRRRLA